MEKYLVKLPIDKEKIEKYMDVISKYAFAIGLFIELTIVLLDKSAYIIQYEGWWFRVTFLLFGLSLITTKREAKQWIWFGIFAIIGFISYKETGRNEILRWVVFIWSCYGKDMKKVLKYTFWYTVFGCAIITLFSIFGIYGEIARTEIYRAGPMGEGAIYETRYCFGMGHPNAFHCMMLVITWLGIYCYHEKLKWYGFALIGVFHIIVFLFTDSKTGLLMSIGTLSLVAIVKCWKKLQSSIWPYLLAIGVMATCIYLSVLMAKYCVNLPILAKLDGYLTGRIFSLWNTTNNEGMLHTWSLWSESRNSYYFDLGIVRFFYWFGIIPGIIYFIAQCRLLWCSYKRNDYMLAVIITVITIYTVFEAHFVSDYMGRNYILFFFGMYLSDMIGVGQKNKSDVSKMKMIK